MIGAIIGDIAGDIYEAEETVAHFQNDTKISFEQRLKALDRAVPLFREGSSFTDDTVLTIAIADAILHNGDYEEYLRKYGTKYRDLGFEKYGISRFGNNFISWLDGKKEGNSVGDGAAMRISAIALFYNSLDKVLEETQKTVIPSHNSREAITGASAVSTAIFLARKGFSKELIKDQIIRKFKYDLDFNLEDLQRNNIFNTNCDDVVPKALYCFLISNDFEDGIRKAISIGGDTDTIASIVGAIGGTYYGIPETLKNSIKEYLNDDLFKIVTAFYERIKNETIN